MKNKDPRVEIACVDHEVFKKPRFAANVNILIVLSCPRFNSASLYPPQQPKLSALEVC